MKIFSYCIPLLIIMSCSPNQDSTNKNELSERNEFQLELKDFFGEIDSTKIVNSIGCNFGCFGHVSPDYVLEIPGSIYETEKRTTYNIGANELICNLHIFEKDSSHLANICTDLIITNYPKPKRKIKSINGRIDVIINNPKKLWGKAFIKVKEIEFIDSLKNNKVIKFKDIIFWEVHNRGVPG